MTATLTNEPAAQYARPAPGQPSPAKTAALAYMAETETATGSLPTATELAERYQRSPRWGRDILKEYREQKAGQPAFPAAEDAPANRSHVNDIEPAETVTGHGIEPADTPAQPAETVPSVRIFPDLGKNTEVTQPATPEPTGRGIASVGFAIGVLASVAGNVAHALLSASPSAGSVVAAGIWPVLLLVAVEVLSRVRWAPGRWYSLARYGGVSAVAAVAALASYSHLSSLLASYGETPEVAYGGPIAIDGLLVLCSFALMSISKSRRV